MVDEEEVEEEVAASNVAKKDTFHVNVRKAVVVEVGEAVVEVEEEVVEVVEVVGVMVEAALVEGSEVLEVEVVEVVVDAAGAVKGAEYP